MASDMSSLVTRNQNMALKKAINMLESGQKLQTNLTEEESDLTKKDTYILVIAEMVKQRLATTSPSTKVVTSE